MKKIWVVQYNDGTADVFDVEHPTPAYPYVDAFEADERIEALRDEVAELRATVAEFEAAQTRPGCFEHQLEELRDAVKEMLHIDTPENFEGGSYLAARTKVYSLITNKRVGHS